MARAGDTTRDAASDVSGGGEHLPGGDRGMIARLMDRVRRALCRIGLHPPRWETMRIACRRTTADCRWCGRNFEYDLLAILDDKPYN